MYAAYVYIEKNEIIYIYVYVNKYIYIYVSYTHISVHVTTSIHDI